MEAILQNPLSLFTSLKGQLERENSIHETAGNKRLKCYCTALSKRSWKMRHGEIPCDGSICAYEREQAEKKLLEQQ